MIVELSPEVMPSGPAEAGAARWRDVVSLVQDADGRAHAVTALPDVKAPAWVSDSDRLWFGDVLDRGL